MQDLTDLPNIGKTLANKLKQAGINSPSDLKEIGSEKAIILIQAIDSEAPCLSMFFALEGAIQGIRWHYLPLEKKEFIKNIFKQIKKITY